MSLFFILRQSTVKLTVCFYKAVSSFNPPCPKRGIFRRGRKDTNLKQGLNRMVTTFLPRLLTFFLSRLSGRSVHETLSMTAVGFEFLPYMARKDPIGLYLPGNQ